MLPALSQIPPDLQDEAIAVIQADPMLREWAHLSDPESCWANFRPRPDRPEQFDQQKSFCDSADMVSFLIGGNAAGTTEAAAYKTAQFLLHKQPPPRRNTPFWIISNTYDQVCGVTWDEKLDGHGHIPHCEVQWDQVSWLRSSRNWPLAVPLKPWPVERGGDPNKNWMLEFKSYEQGRTALQARSIGGFWFSEQFPLDLFLETLRGCREYMYPGGQFAEFTPIEPELCLWVEKAMDDRPDGWAFYRCNTELNKINLADGWYENFFAGVPDEMLETRRTGALATFEGVIYQSFNPAIHVIGGATVFPPGVQHYRGVDWGASEEHPFTCVWAYRDGQGDWYIYDEYWNNSQAAITLDHVEAIVERSIEWNWPGRWSDDPALTASGPVFMAGDSQWHLGTFADPSRPGELNEFNFRGITTHAGANDVLKGIDCIRALLKIQTATERPRLFIHERCAHLIQEMRKYRWLKGRKPTRATLLNPKVATAAPLKRDDDTADALRYMIYSVERGFGAVPGSMSHQDYDKRRGIQLRRGGDGVARGGNGNGAGSASGRLGSGFFSKG